MITLNEIIFFLAGFLLWIPIYIYFIIPATAKAARREWRNWALSPDGNDVLVEVLTQEQGVIEHIAHASAEMLKLTLSGGFGQVAKQLNNNPQIAMASGMAEQLKDMKWYESALLMKIAQQIPELQPLLGLAEGAKKAVTSNSKPDVSPAQASN